MALKTPATPAKPKAAGTGGSFLTKLFGGKKSAATGSASTNIRAAAAAGAAAAPSAGAQPSGSTSGFGATGEHTRKIRADVAANKVAKPKSARGPMRIPLIGGQPIVRQLQILAIAAGGFMVLSIVAVFLDRQTSGYQATYTNVTSQLQFHTQRLAKSAGLAARGDPIAFPQLQDSRDEFQRYLDVLNEGGFAFNNKVPSAKINDEITSRIEELTKRFADASKNATSILAAKNDLTDLTRNVAQVRAGADDLAALSQDLTGLMQQSGAPPAQVLKVNRLTFLAERLGRGSAEILGAEIIDPEVPFQIGKDTNDFRELIKAMEGGSEALGIAALRDADSKAKMIKLRDLFGTFEKNIGPILGNVQKLVSARQSGRALQQGSESLLANVEQLQNAFAGDTRNLALWMAIVFGAVALLFLGLIALVFLSDARRRAAESEAENKRNQEAILRLLNEMGDLADGDLTIRAKVTEDITGAIADSMNYTIDELRTLVTGVNNASNQVSVKSQQAQAVSVQLIDAAEKQSKEIQETTQDVLKVAETLTQVSSSAEESSQVAMRSLAAADKGRLAVQNSIAGMNDIREQIQETSKRIKRLGESSQEIGEIVELISDITEQTNVLALNAAIQAASAGEAGRGFSVVAEEVQRLAERSGEATKQIGAIVKTIQADTQDAVAAMEKSTTGVVEGAKLSDAAGQALTEIDSVTKNLASLIQRISSDATQQAASANKAARNMQDILEINRQTTAGTQQTASSIKELAEVASDLKASVSGFKL
ncbi:MAG: type IV pili methyl-accepting chemotaxis transducer N-terminal domain-containing protein [Betaproteobacteria bacterium]|nr:type IV pili methyl-accepting chemotaxis transducer N-terminal domain-containing protein [Betaproteobacteria bacterium]